MSVRTITSPGVEVFEYDNSQYATTPVGTSVLLMGFAANGPSDEILQITSMEEFEQVYGKPTNPAERYFYHSASQLYSSNANVYAARLPYGESNGEGFGDKYGALVYPVQGYTLNDGVELSSIEFDGKNWLSGGNLIELSSIGKQVENSTLSDAEFIVFSKPKHVDLTKKEYQDISENGISNNPELSGYGMAILNSSQTTINNQFEGYYIGIADNYNMEPYSPYDATTSAQSVNNNSYLSSLSTLDDTNFVQLPEARINFSLSSSANSNVNSTSEVLENIPPYSLWGNEYIDCVTLGLFKLRRSVYSPDTIKLDYSVQEAYYGSFDYYRKEQTSDGGPEISMYVGKKINDNSNDLKIVINKGISNEGNETFLNIDGLPTKKIRFSNDAKALFALGSYTSTTVTDKKIGSLPDKIQRIFNKIEDPELFDLDLTIEAGLGTIWVYSKENGGIFDDTLDLTNVITNNGAGGGFYNTGLTELSGTAAAIKENYATIGNLFITFAQKTRKDHLAILDPLRFTCVKGKDLKILQAVDESGKSYNFSQHYYWPLRYQFMFANTSYAAVYNNWGKVYDSSFNGNIWIPMSGTLASIITYSSTVSYPWFAPAGFTRGVVTTVSDIAVYANQKQRDQLYKIAINPIAYFPNDGICVYGQKTLQSKASAFDRINVRRLFLYLEKAVMNTMKYYVFEPNDYVTRTQVFNTLNPIFKQVQEQRGMYQYRIICNSNNNTDEVIDKNELVVDIYIAPTKSAEFILTNFYAERTGSAIFTENM